MSEWLLEAVNFGVTYPVRSTTPFGRDGKFQAVNGVNIRVAPGRVVAVVGESGCGKSSLGHGLLGLLPAVTGSLSLFGGEVDVSRPASWAPYRTRFQVVFQDPYSSLNPRHTVYETLAEPMLAHRICEKKQAPEQVAGLLGTVGLGPEHAGRFPHALSGGQRQRAAIARALSVRPQLLLCDEITSALDVSIQAQIVRLLLMLKDRMGLSLLFITHDLALVKAVADEVMVMYLGRMVEQAPAEALFAAPAHPYTRALLDAVPGIHPGRRPRVLAGEAGHAAPGPGCAFASRCPRARGDCRAERPSLALAGAGAAACFHPLEAGHA